MLSILIELIEHKIELNIRSNKKCVFVVLQGYLGKRVSRGVRGEELSNGMQREKQSGKYAYNDQRRVQRMAETEAQSRDQGGLRKARWQLSLGVIRGNIVAPHRESGLPGCCGQEGESHVACSQHQASDKTLPLHLNLVARCEGRIAFSTSQMGNKGVAGVLN